MTAAFATLSERRRADSIARGFASESVRGRREDAARFLASGVDMLRHGIECGVDKATLQDMANALHDAVSNLDGQMRRDLDNHGIIHQHTPLCMADLDELRGRIA